MEPIKVQIWRNFTWAVVTLHFDRFLLSLLCNISAEMYRRVIPQETEEWCKVKKKNWIVLSNTTWIIWWIFTQPLKSLKISVSWALFVQSIEGLSYKNTEKFSFMKLNSHAQFNKPWSCGFKNGMRNWVNFHCNTTKSPKNCTLIGSSYQKHIMFYPEHFIGIMHYDIRMMQHLKENWLVAWKMT